MSLGKQKLCFIEKTCHKFALESLSFANKQSMKQFLLPQHNFQELL